MTGAEVAEIMPLIQTGIGGINLAFVVLVLYRQSQAEKKIELLQKDHIQIGKHVAVLLALGKEKRHEI